MTRDEFERNYADKCGLTVDELHYNLGHYAIPCNCGEPECKGWQMRNLANLLIPGLHFETEHIPDDWDGQDLLDDLIADGQTHLVAALRQALEDKKKLKIKDHTIGAWLKYLLFKLLPPKWFLRTQGVKLYNEPHVIVTVTYNLHGNEKQAQVEFGNAMAAVKVFPLWFDCGFFEPASLEGERYFIPPHDIEKVEWHDPVLEDHLEYIKWFV